MSTQSVSFTPASTINNTIKSDIVVISSAAAIVGVAVLAIGLLSNYQILTGLNALTQKTLIGVGAGVGVVSTAVSMASYFSIIHSFKTRLTSYDEVLKELGECIDQGKDPLKAIKKLAKEVPFEKLQEFVQTKYSGHTDALLSAKRMVGQAEEYLSLREGASPTLNSRIRSSLDTLIAVIDSILVAFGVADFFKPADSQIHGEFKFQKILMLLSLFTLLTATLLPMLGVTAGASIVGGILLLICVMSLIWPHIRPQPSRIPEGENWSKQIREGKLKAVRGRQKQVHEVAQALTNGQHPLLIGPSGIGKTQTVRAFVQALEDGEFPELKGKTVFYFNTANLVTSKELFGGGNKILKRISEAIGRHRENAILVFDEIHLAYQVKQSQSAIGEQLKTYLDEKADNFPYVIGLTTSEEYLQHIYQENSAGDRRFKKIEIESMDDDATQVILSQFLVQNAPDVIVEKGALEYLVEKTSSSLQPLSAQRILSQCVSQLSLPKDSPKSIEAEKTRVSLNKIYTTGMLLGNASIVDETPEMTEEVAQLETQLRRLETELKTEGAKMRSLAQTRKHLAKAREEKFRLAKTVSDKGGAQLSEFILLKYFLEGALEARVRAKGAEIGVETTLNQTLINKVLKNEADSVKKRNKVLGKSRQALQERRE